MAEVLRILSKQKSLNYEPGTAYSYTNSGYNLLEFIVERVSGKSLQQFNKEKIFGPLGMNHTQWREDFRTVVPRRAIAYAKTGQTYTQRMPFENVTGSGGLLTTVGDLLRWNRALEEGKLGATFASQMQQTGVLKSGKAITYALGLNVETYRGASHIYHEGLTAGYHAWLSRFPNRSLSISILCNSQNIETFPLAHEIADIFLHERKPATKSLSRDEMTKLEGLYVSRRSGMPLSLVQHNGSLFVNTNGSASPGADAPPLTKDPEGRLVSGKMNFEIVGDGLLRQAAAGDWIDFDKLPVASSSSPDTRGVPGRYNSKELDATFIVTETPKCLSMAIEDRPSRTRCLTPVYEGAFLFRSTLVRPVRTPAGSVTGLRFSNERVWDLRAEKID